MLDIYNGAASLILEGNEACFWKRCGDAFSEKMRIEKVLSLATGSIKLPGKIKEFSKKQTPCQWLVITRGGLFFAILLSNL